MPAGRLRERVEFQRNDGTTDAFGGTSEAWTAIFTSNAEFQYQKGDEALQAARQAGRQAYKIKVRASNASRAVTTDYRMRDTREDVTYNVTDVDLKTSRSWVWLTVEGPVS